MIPYVQDTVTRVAALFVRKAWNRTRYYWPQAQSRRRAIANLRAGYEWAGMTYKSRRPWWLP